MGNGKPRGWPTCLGAWVEGSRAASNREARRQLTGHLVANYSGGLNSDKGRAVLDYQEDGTITYKGQVVARHIHHADGGIR